MIADIDFKAVNEAVREGIISPGYAAELYGAEGSDKRDQQEVAPCYDLTGVEIAYIIFMFACIVFAGHLLFQVLS